MIYAWLIQLAIAIAVSAVSYVLMPKPKGPKPGAVEQSESPTAEAGRPVPKLWGTARVSETNVLGFWDKSSLQSQIKL